MKTYQTQRVLISSLFQCRIFQLEGRLTVLKRRLANPGTRLKSIPNILQEIEWKTEWLAETQEGFQQFKQTPEVDSLPVSETTRLYHEMDRLYQQCLELMADAGFVPQQYFSPVEISIRLTQTHRLN